MLLKMKILSLLMLLPLYAGGLRLMQCQSWEDLTLLCLGVRLGQVLVPKWLNNKLRFGK